MYQFFDTLTDDSGNSLYQATVAVSIFPSGAPATIYSTNGTANPIANSTVISDITGQISFYVPDGAYILTYSYKGTPYKARGPVQVMDYIGFLPLADIGAVNAMVLTDSRLAAQLYVGMRVTITVANTNTAASPTLTVNGTGAQAVTIAGGVTTYPGTFVAGGDYSFIWTGSAWLLLSQPSISAAIIGTLLYPQTTAEADNSVVPVNFQLPELDPLRYDTGNVQPNSNWLAVYRQYQQYVFGASVVPFPSFNTAEWRMGYVRPEWFAPNFTIQSADTGNDAAIAINAAIAFLVTRNPQGSGHATGTLLFDAKVYLCQTPITFYPFINYLGTRASTADAVSNFTTLSSSRGTILRAYTTLYNLSTNPLGTLVYVPAGDLTVRDITLVGTAQINGNPSIGLQLGASGAGYGYETAAASAGSTLVSGLNFSGITCYTFQQAWYCCWTGDSFAYQCRFESNVVNILLTGNSTANSSNELHLTGCIHFNHATGIEIQNQGTGRTWTQLLRQVGGYFFGQSSAGASQHIAMQTNPSPNSLDMEFTAVYFTQQASGSRHVLWNANYTSSAQRLRFNSCEFTGLSSIYQVLSGGTAANNIEYRNCDFLGGHELIFSNVTDWAVIGGTHDTTSYIELDTSNTNWRIEGVRFQYNLSANFAIDITTANCGPGIIDRPIFDSGVTNAISINNNATNATIQVNDPVGYTSTPAQGTIRNFNPGVQFANLGTPANGSVVFCPNGTIADPVAGGGNGCIAKRLNGVWVGN